MFTIIFGLGNMLALTAAFATAASGQNAVQEWILQQSLKLSDDEYRAMNRAISAKYMDHAKSRRENSLGVKFLLSILDSS